MDEEIGAHERAILAAVGAGKTKSTDLTKVASGAPNREVAVKALETRGWLRRIYESAKSYHCELTEIGTAMLVQLPPLAKPVRAARTKAAASTSDELRVMIATLLDERLAPIAARLERLAGLVERREAPATAEPLGPTLLEAVTRLDSERQYGGLVPIPALRRELTPQGNAAARDLVDVALFTLEQDGVVQLLVAQSPTTLTDRADGIERAGRGLIYYVARSGS